MSVDAAITAQRRTDNEQTTVTLLECLREAAAWLECYGPSMPAIPAYANGFALLNFVPHSPVETLTLVDWLMTGFMRGEAPLVRGWIAECIRTGVEVDDKTHGVVVQWHGGTGFVQRWWGNLYVQIIVTADAR